MKKLKRDLRDIIILAVISISFLFVVMTYIDTNQFPYDNIRYAYSAIFQGFSALLALTITSILITLQNIHSQKFSVEESIIKLLSVRFEEHVPGTINQIEKNIETEEFRNVFKSYLVNRMEHSEKQSGYIVEKTIEEIQRKIYFLNAMTKKEIELQIIFKISLGMISIVLLYTLTALIIIPSNPELIEIDPIDILIIAVVLVLISLMILMKSMMDILYIWQFKPERIQKEIHSQFKIE